MKKDYFFVFFMIFRVENLSDPFSPGIRAICFQSANLLGHFSGELCAVRLSQDEL